MIDTWKINPRLVSGDNFYKPVMTHWEETYFTQRYEAFAKF